MAWRDLVCFFIYSFDFGAERKRKVGCEAKGKTDIQTIETCKIKRCSRYLLFILIWDLLEPGWHQADLKMQFYCLLSFIVANKKTSGWKIMYRWAVQRFEYSFLALSIRFLYLLVHVLIYTNMHLANACISFFRDWSWNQQETLIKTEKERIQRNNLCMNELRSFHLYASFLGLFKWWFIVQILLSF